MTCADCGLRMDEIAGWQPPCPRCGAMRWDATVQAAATLAGVAVIKASMSIGYNPHRPWHQKWRDTLDGINQIERLYAQEDMNNEIVRRVVEGFFKSCRELADWLWEDSNANVTKPVVMGFVTNEAALRICDGMAQTTKHHTRRTSDPDPLTARISEIGGGSGVRAKIDWSMPSGANGTEDSLDLARRCVAAWQNFFQQHGLDPAGG